MSHLRMYEPDQDPRRGSMGIKSPPVTQAEAEAALDSLLRMTSVARDRTEILPQYWANELFLQDHNGRHLFLAKCLDALHSYLLRENPDWVFSKRMQTEALDKVIGRPLNGYLAAGDWVRYLHYLHTATKERRPWSDWHRYLVHLYLVNHIWRFHRHD